MLAFFLISLLKFLMGHIELLWGNDSFMSILHEELSGLPVIDLTLCKKILLKSLLEDGVATVLLILECPDDILTTPFLIPPTGLHTQSHKLLGNGIWGLSLAVPMVTNSSE